MRVGDLFAWLCVAGLVAPGPNTYSYSALTATTRYANVNVGGAVWSTVHLVGTGTIQFSTLSSTHAIGFFSFTAGPMPGSATSNYIVTELG